MPGLFEGSDGSPKQEEPLSPLHAAVDAEDVDQVCQLAATADPVDLNAALCRSCQCGKITSTQALLETGRCDVNAAVDGDTLLFLAAKKVQLEIVSLLLQHGADVTIRSKNKRPRAKLPAFTPLHGVVDSLYPYPKLENLPRYEELMQVLLDAGCDINAQDTHGNTALLLSVHKEIALVPFLLQHGADPNIAEDQGGTAMHFFHHPLDHPEWFKGLMAKGARLDIVRDADGHTPLHAYASKWQLGDLSLFQPFVSDWSITDGNGDTLLHIATAKHRRGSNTIVELLKLGIDPNQRNHKGQQPIHKVEGSEEDVQDALNILCAAGADLEARNYDGCTLLTKTMYGKQGWNCRELLPYLISRGANINAQDYKGNGVLSYLIKPYHFRPEHLEFLLSLGADPKMANYEGDTLLHHLAANFATIDQDTALLAMIQLIKMGVSSTMPNFRGRTPLHMLCSQSSDNLFAATAQGGKCAIDLLLDAGLGVALNMSDHQGIRPVHLAATVSEHLVGKLLARGADITVSTKDGRNLLHIASTARQSNSVGLILDHCDSKNLALMLNAQSEDGRTPLHVACRSGRLETVNLLLAYGADVNIEDKHNRTPLDACAESIAEDQLWQGIDDQENVMNMRSAAGVLVQDNNRPTQPTSNMETKHRNTKGLGWEGEIRSESSTAGIGQIIRALASHGAFAYEKKSGAGPMYYAVEEGNEEMAVELDRLSREMGLPMENNRHTKTEYCLLRSQHLPDLLQKQFKEYVSERNVLPMILLGHHEEVVQALETNASVIDTKFSMPEIMASLARWGFSELFGRIGNTMSGIWINGGDTNIWGKKLTPHLLMAAQRDLPNLDVIRVMVEKFNADVNIKFQADMVHKPRVICQTKMTLERHYKPGDTILHQLAHGTHWWYGGAIRYLLEHGADPNAQNDQGKTPLCYAVSRGELGGYRQLEITRILLEGGADPNLAATCGYTPLAMSAHDTQLFQLLIEHGAYPSQDHPMELFAALSSFNKDVVSALLGMDLDCNKTVLSDAQPHWHTHRVQKVPKIRGATLSPLFYISMLPFNEANCREHACRMIEFLLECGADSFLPCSDTQVVLHETFASGGIVQPWLDMTNLDLERRDPTGKTLLLAAASSTTGTHSYACTCSAYPLRAGEIALAPWKEGDPTRAMALYERGADLRAVDYEGNNVLHYLADLDCSHDHFASIETQRTLSLFVDKAPELVQQTNVHGQTPWAIAAEKNFVEFMEILRTDHVRAE
jgi:ankyrin repeat protein